MALARTLVQIGRRGLGDLRRLARGEPRSFAALSSMTLDGDDVALAESWLARRKQWDGGDEVERYHAAFAAWNGSRHAFSFMAGRVALSAIIDALELEPGDQVIVPGYTCVVVANAFAYAGVDAVWADIELDTYGLDASRLEAHITSRTRAVLLHHLYGLVCRDYAEIVAIARRRGLLVIEDCAHSAGAEYKDRKVGNLGDAAFYSSEQSKVFNTIQGGLAVTNRDDLAARLRSAFDRAPAPDARWTEALLRAVALHHSRARHPGRWWVGDLLALRLGDARAVSTSPEEERGIRPAHYGCRMPAPLAALGRNQLGKIDAYNARRRETAARWDRWCDASGRRRPLVVEQSLPIYLRYPVLVDAEMKRERRWAEVELGVRPGVWFASHLHPAQRSVPGCPNADEAVARCVNLPTLL